MQDESRKVAGCFRAKTTLIERQMSVNLEAPRSSDDRGIGQPNLKIAIRDDYTADQGHKPSLTASLRISSTLCAVSVCPLRYFPIPFGIGRLPALVE
jgi:hypothetical protein